MNDKIAAEWVDIDTVRPWAKNPRNNEHAVPEVMASIKRFGFGAPLLVRRANGEIISGHTRHKAAVRLGLDRIPVRFLDLDEHEAHALALADNRLGELADWDDTTLRSVLDELSEVGTLLDGLGWSLKDLEAIGREDSKKEIVEDDAPEPPATPITKVGDLWILGEHRVLCGDSTDENCVAKLMNGLRAEMMVTDPPYGVKYDPGWRSEVNNDGANSKRALGTVLNDERADWTQAWQLFDGDVAYVWHADRYTHVVAESLERCDFEVRYLIIWAKQRHTFGRGHYHHQHEPCWYVVKSGSTAMWQGDRKQTTIWNIDNNRNNETGHSTQKPVECMARPIRNHTAKLIYDPFLGSGTTLIAAEQLGRKCYGMELNPAYVDVIVKRWQTLTGRVAVLESTGRAFGTISAS